MLYLFVDPHANIEIADAVKCASKNMTIEILRPVICAELKSKSVVFLFDSL